MGALTGTSVMSSTVVALRAKSLFLKRNAVQPVNAKHVDRPMSKLMDRLKNKKTWIDACAFIICSALAFLPTLVLDRSLGFETIFLIVFLVVYWVFIRSKLL